MPGTLRTPRRKAKLCTAQRPQPYHRGSGSLACVARVRVQAEQNIEPQEGVFANIGREKDTQKIGRKQEARKIGREQKSQRRGCASRMRKLLLGRPLFCSARMGTLATQARSSHKQLFRPCWASSFPEEVRPSLTKY